MPPSEPPEPSQGLCINPTTPIVHLPLPEGQSQASQVLLRPKSLHTPCCQLVSSRPDKPLEADRPELFEVVVPGAEAVAVGCNAYGWVMLQPAPGRVGVFAGVVVLPRSSRVWVRALLPKAAAGAAGEVAVAGAAAGAREVVTVKGSSNSSSNGGGGGSSAASTSSSGGSSRSSSRASVSSSRGQSALGSGVAAGGGAGMPGASSRGSSAPGSILGPAGGGVAAAAPVGGAVAAAAAQAEAAGGGAALLEGGAAAQQWALLLSMHVKPQVRGEKEGDRREGGRGSGMYGCQAL